MLRISRRLHILTLLAALLAAIMWARSYWRFDFGVARGWTLGSESGSCTCSTEAGRKPTT
jgi:hypothetical protein